MQQAENQFLLPADFFELFGCISDASFIVPEDTAPEDIPICIEEFKTIV